MKLVSERITVACEGEPSRPASFVWHGETFNVAEVLATWQDWGFSGGAPRRRTWRMRRHRTYFRVRTADERVFELYLDRGAKSLQWFLHSEQDD